MKAFISGVLLNPSLKGELQGYTLLPKMGFDEEREVTYVASIELLPNKRIPYPLNSSFMFGSGLVPILLPSIDSPDHRDQAFTMLCKELLRGDLLKVQNNEPWFALTDLKRSGDAVAFCGSHSRLSEVMGADLYKIKDPIKSFKVLLPPSRLLLTGSKGLAGRPGYIRVALASLDTIKTDGGIISKVGLKHADYSPTGEIGPMWNEKFSFQIRHNTMSIGSGQKKGKVTYDPALHRYLCKLGGFDHKDCDWIMAVDNIKSSTSYRIGDIIDLPLNEIRIIKLKERQSPTRGGAQIRRIPWSALRELMVEKGGPNVAAAVVMKEASLGDAHAIAHILQVPFSPLPGPNKELKDALTVLSEDKLSKDTSAYFEDGLGLFIQILGAARWNGERWMVPMYGDAFTAIMGRLRSWYFDRVIKLRLGDFSFYVEVCPHLKKSECILPNVPLLLSEANEEGVYLTGMRPPIVSRGNLQPLTPLRHKDGSLKVNGTDDTIYVSPESLLSMFGDTDGDMLYVITSHTKFKYRPRRINEESKFPVTPPSTAAELCNLIVSKSSQVAQASLEVGLRDRAASIIYDERQLSGDPISDHESTVMAEDWLENAIKSFKHDGTSIMGDQAIYCMCSEFGTDNMRKTGLLPKRPLPQTQLFRRKIGAVGRGSANDKVKMKSLAFELEKFFTHPVNIELGICEPGRRAHPYAPVWTALRGFTAEEKFSACVEDSKLFQAQWENVSKWISSKDKRAHHTVFEMAKKIEALYNSSASFAIALASYSGTTPEPWWPFCIYSDIQNRRAWATHVRQSKMIFSFEKTSSTGYKNNLSGEVSIEELYELLSTGRISTLQKRERFRKIKEEVNSYIERCIDSLISSTGISREAAHKSIATALASRVFGMRRNGSGVRNGREFMALEDDIKLSVYNVVFKSPWGLLARQSWDTLKSLYASIEVIEEEDEIEEV